MQPSFWLERWTNDQIGFHQREVNPILQAHWSAIAAFDGATVFVPLCGKSLDMLWLRDQGYGILGVEFIQKAVNDFFAENELSATVTAEPPFVRWTTEDITILAGDFFELTAEQLRDVRAVYDRASLIALPTDRRAHYVEHMSAILRPGTETLLITLSYPSGEMKGPPFSVSNEEVHTLYDGAFSVTSLAELDVLEKNVHLRARGLTSLTERAYRLRRLGG